MVCLSAELKKERSIKEPLEVNQKNLVKVVKHIDAVLLLIEQGTLCFTLSLEEHSVTTASSSSSTLQWILL